MSSNYRVRNPLSTALMMLPLTLTVVVGLLFWPSVMGRFEVFLDLHTGKVNTAPGIVMYVVGLGPGVAAPWVGWLGRYPAWQSNRKFQRALLGSVSACGFSVFAGTLSLTLSRSAGEVPEYGTAMFGTICALAYGGLCAAVTPPDRVDIEYR